MFNTSLHKQHNVNRSIPFVVVEKDGEIVQSVVGAQSEMTYSNILKGLL